MRTNFLSILLLIQGASAAHFAPSKGAVASLDKPSILLGKRLSASGVAAANAGSDSLVETTEESSPSPRPLAFIQQRGGGGPPSRSTLIAIGCLLAANSGFMNGLALSGSVLGKGQAVAAVTGAWTSSAFSASARKTQLQMILSYLSGSAINGVMNPNGVDWSSAPNALLVAAGLVVGSYYLMGQSNGSHLTIWSLLALANGLQNSWTSSLLAGNVLRTAHFSGITSDMGTFIGQIIRGNSSNAWKLRIFAALAASFWTGGYLSTSAAKEFGREAFLGNVGLYVALYAYLSMNGKVKFA